MMSDKYTDKLIGELRKLESQKKLSLLAEYSVDEKIEDEDIYLISDQEDKKSELRVFETDFEKAEDCSSEASLLGFLKTNSVIRVDKWEYAKLSKKRGYLLTVSEAAQRIEAPLSPEEAVKLGTDITSVLEECHMTGLLHLCITPSSLRRADDGSYKITDFGAVRIDPRPNDFSAPEYRALKDFDHRADIYSLSLSIYSLLGGDIEDGEELKPIDGCPQALIDVLRKACSSDPEERYAFMRPFGIALERCLGGDTVDDDDSENDAADEVYEGNDGEDCFADRADYENSEREKPELDDLFEEEKEEESVEEDIIDEDEDDDEEQSDENDGGDKSEDKESSDSPQLWDRVECSRARAAGDIILMIIIALALLAFPAVIKLLSC